MLERESSQSISSEMVTQQMSASYKGNPTSNSFLLCCLLLQNGSDTQALCCPGPMAIGASWPDGGPLTFSVALEQTSSMLIYSLID